MYIYIIYIYIIYVYILIIDKDILINRIFIISVKRFYLYLETGLSKQTK